jgi:hypothetical protein
MELFLAAKGVIVDSVSQINIHALTPLLRKWYGTTEKPLDSSRQLAIRSASTFMNYS